MAGAASHIDLWDYKPALEKHHGEPSDFGEKVEAFQNGLGPWMQSPFKFQRYGQSGKMISEVVADLGSVRRRHRVHSQHDRQDRCAQSSDLPAGDWISTARFSRDGCLDQLRARARRMKICQRLSCCPIIADSPAMDPRTGVRLFCRRVRKGRRFFRSGQNRSTICFRLAIWLRPPVDRDGLKLLESDESGFCRSTTRR